MKLTKWTPIIQGGARPGALAGLFGGLLSGWALLQIGTLPATASLVRVGPVAVGLTLHVAGATILGAAFGVLVWQQRAGAGETLFWGLTYGTIVWFLGPLTVMPLLQIGVIAWDVHSAQEAFESLLAHLLYGASTGLAMAALRRGQAMHTAARRRSRGVLVMVIALGSFAGLLGGTLLVRVAGSVMGAGSTLAVGTLGGLVLSVLYPIPPAGTGPAIIRGMVFGFFWWFLWPLTLLSIGWGGGLAWSLGDVRSAFVVLPGYLLYGAALGLAYNWIAGLARLLFSDNRVDHEQEGMGTEGLNAIWRGALAGLAGGVVFAGALVQIGALSTIARLIGMASPAAGLVVHLMVSLVIGTGYGLLFRRQSFDLGSALGWGVSYGFLWWVLGALTLMPIMLGGSAEWTVQATADRFASLIGHLAYGATLGVVFHILEAHYNPWWLPVTRAQQTRIARRKEQLQTSAPALWALVIVIALTLPLLLSQ
jgi:uncharacterized membrane protein YagU involved in acid resistance